MALVLVTTTQAEDKSAEDRGRSFLKNIREEIKRDCVAKKGKEYFDCIEDLTPKKCKSLVYVPGMSAWSRCVFFCGQSSFYDRSLGECSE
jgi:hypothetical protein